MTIEVVIPYLYLVGNTILGLLILVISQLTHQLAWVNSLFILLLFIAINLIYSKFFGLSNELVKFWNIRKIYGIIYGTLVGLFIASTPTLFNLIFLNVNGFNPKLNPLNISSIFITLVIVSWEELWFRSLILNQCNKRINTLTLSFTIGILFMLIHLLNPQIKIIESGLGLFLAGTFLTLSYFLFESIWIPIGLHFGNNVFGNIISLSSDKSFVLPNFELITNIVLIVFISIEIIIYLRKQKSPQL